MGNYDISEMKQTNTISCVIQLTWNTFFYICHNSSGKNRIFVGQHFFLRQTLLKCVARLLKFFFCKFVTMQTHFVALNNLIRGLTN